MVKGHETNFILTLSHRSLASVLLTYSYAATVVAPLLEKKNRFHIVVISPKVAIVIDI